MANASPDKEGLTNPPTFNELHEQRVSENRLRPNLNGLKHVSRNDMGFNDGRYCTHGRQSSTHARSGTPRIMLLSEAANPVGFLPKELKC